MSSSHLTLRLRPNHQSRSTRPHQPTWPTKFSVSLQRDAGQSCQRDSGHTLHRARWARGFGRWLLCYVVLSVVAAHDKVTALFGFSVKRSKKLFLLPLLLPLILLIPLPLLLYLLLVLSQQRCTEGVRENLWAAGDKKRIRRFQYL